MPHGRAIWITLLATLLAAPAFPGAAAAAPAPHDAAQSTGPQDIADLAIDPTGQVALVVENVAASSSSPGGTLPSGTCIPNLTCPAAPSQISAQPNVYVCDFSTSGQGCRTASHLKSPTSGSTSLTQAAAATTFTTPSGTQTAFAVAGPGDLVSYWVSSESQAHWESAMGSMTSPVSAINASIEPNGQRALFSTRTLGSGTATGTLVMFDALGNQKWSYALVDSQQNPTYTTGMAWARNDGLVAIGTPGGVDLLVPSDTGPASSDDLHPFNTSPVNAVAISAAGDAVAAATNGYTYYMRIDPVSHAVIRPVFNRQSANQGPVQAVAMSSDGLRFASASGTRISFFHAISNSAIAQYDGDYDAGQTVTDLGFDGSGRILVASTALGVLGFTPQRASACPDGGAECPVWYLDGANAGLTVPVRHARVADAWFDGVYHPTQDATRLVAAGTTKVAAFDLAVAATANLSAPVGSAIVPGMPLPLQLMVQNTGSLTDNFSFVVQQPLTTTNAPWVVNSVPPMRLDPDQVAYVNITVTAPYGQAPGSYPVVIEVHALNANGKPPACSNSPDTLACATTNVTLARTILLSMTGPDEKQLMKQGTDDNIALAITNNGNADGIVNLTATQAVSRGSGWPLAFRPSNQVRIPVGNTVTVNLVLSSPPGALSGDKDVLTVYAKEGDTAVAMRNFTAYVDAVFGSDLNATNSSLQLLPGEERDLILNVHNTGNTDDLYNLSYSVSPAAANNTDWRVVISMPQANVPLGQIKGVAFSVKNLATTARDATVTITATSTSDPAGSQSSFVIALTAKPVVTTPAARGNFLPGPSPILVISFVALAAALRCVGGRRP